MAYFYPEPSHTFSEYLLVPNLTRKDCTPAAVDLSTPLVKHRSGEKPSIRLNVPFASAIMQSVSDHQMAIGLARCGGIAFIFVSQPVASQAEMVGRAKRFKAGFVPSDSNLRPHDTLRDVLALREKTGHTTMAVTADGSPTGKLLGILTSRDYRLTTTPPEAPIADLMTKFSDLVYGVEGIGLSEANDLIWQHKLNTLPVISRDGNLAYLVFRKDYAEHKENPRELVDSNKRLVVGAGINTRDYRERVPALVAAGADVLCIDSSDGFSEWQADTLQWIKKTYGEAVKVGGGNVVDAEGFRFLVDAGADFVKVGIGGGSICITREQKGIGRGQATAVIEVASARDEYLTATGTYVPICSDGGIVQDYHIALAIAMGADFVMMGRFFARFDEAPGRRLRVGGSFVKEYWGEGSNRARNWQRYHEAGLVGPGFEEGVDGYVPYAGKLKDNLDITLDKIRSAMVSCGALSIPEFQSKARVTLASAVSIREGSAHDIVLKENEIIPTA
ncbi:MAG TPA: IMP dehydrogenase [Spirochaetia bacterium]|nr:IMP dehydrogenase [Spirochaetia bacterium]